jgi:hypothetical protein
MCELACSANHEGAYRHTNARLRVDCNPTTAEITGLTCLQTGCAKIVAPKIGDTVTIHERNDGLKGVLPEVGYRVVVRWGAEHSFLIGEEAGPVPGEDARPAPGGETLEIPSEER